MVRASEVNALYKKLIVLHEDIVGSVGFAAELNEPLVTDGTFDRGGVHIVVSEVLKEQAGSPLRGG